MHKPLKLANNQLKIHHLKVVHSKFYFVFKMCVKMDIQKAKKSVCDRTHRILSTRNFNLLRPKLHLLHSCLIIHQPVQKSHISYYFSEKTKRDNAQKRMSSLSKLIYIINNLVAECFFYSYFVFQIKKKVLYGI